MSDKKQQARHIYMNESCTQREIAAQLGVSERTVYNWIHGEGWDRLRQAAYAAPVMIAENICNQLAEMQMAIAAREPGQRFPTPQEAEVTRKLVTCLEKMKKYPSLPQNMQALQTFRQYVNERAGSQFARDLLFWQQDYLGAEAKHGFFPFQVEFGLNKVPPVHPFTQDEDTVLPPAEETGNTPEETLGTVAAQEVLSTDIGTTPDTPGNQPAPTEKPEIFSNRKPATQKPPVTIDSKGFQPVSGYPEDRKRPEIFLPGRVPTRLHAFRERNEEEGLAIEPLYCQELRALLAIQTKAKPNIHK